MARGVDENVTTYYTATLFIFVKMKPISRTVNKRKFWIQNIK